jgi:uncharacterized protein involved in type VI secretion and phage assembly
MLEQIAPLLARYTQATRLLRLTTPPGTEQLLAEYVSGKEAVSEGFTFTISALSLDAGISLQPWSASWRVAATAGFSRT